MEIIHHDQDRSNACPRETSPRETEPDQRSANRFIPTESLRFDEPERLVPAGDRIPAVILHPNGIVRLGIHHAWSTSHFIVVRAAATNWQQLQLKSNTDSVRIGIFGLPQSDQIGFEARLSELAMLVRQHSHIRWVVVATSVPSGCRQAIAETGASGLVEGEFTSEQLESVVMWVDAGRRIGLDEPTGSIESRESNAISEEQTKSSSATSPLIAKDSDGSYPSAIASSSDAATALKDLSEREEQVLEGLAEGKTNQQIANGLFLSVKTIETYRSRLKQKLRVSDRASMVAILNRQRQVC